MKTSRWIFLLALLFVLCAGAALLTGSGPEASQARITSDGSLVTVVDLNVDGSFTVEAENGYNIITVKDGKIAVTEASCPDHHCMNRGFCSRGTQIVCLPNRLVIEFLGEAEIDGVSG